MGACIHRQLYVASLLGTPIAAAWFLSSTYRIIGRPKYASTSVLAGVPATILVGVVAFFLPERMPNLVWPFAYGVGIYYGAQHLIGRSVVAAMASGRRRGSWWNVVGISLLSGLIFAALFFGIAWSVASRTSG